MQENPSKNRSLKRLKYLLIFTLGFVFLIVGLIFSITQFYHKEIKNIALKKLNSQLNIPISVDDVEINVFTYFPKVSISLKNFHISEKLNSKDTLIYCQNLDLNFNAIDLINKKYNVRKLVVNNGFLNIHISEKGIKNYLVLKENKESENFKFNLDNVSFNSFIFNYQNDILLQDYSLLFENSSFSGDFNEDLYQLEIQSSLFVNHFNISEVDYIKNKKANLSLSLDVVNDPFSLKLENGKLEIAEMNFTINGDYISSSNDEIDLSIQGDNIQIAEVFSVFPIDYFSIIERYSTKGTLYFNASLKGNISQKVPLFFKADFNIENASFKDLENNISMSNIVLSGDFNNRDKLLKVESFSTLFDNKKINGSFKIKDFKNPLLNINIDGSFDLKNMSFFLPNNTFEITGITKFELSTELKWHSSSTAINYINGKVNSNEVQLRYPITNFNAKINDLQLDFPRKDLIIKAKKVIVKKDEFVPYLKLSNWVNLLFENSKKLVVDFKLDFNHLNLNDWLSYIPKINDSSRSKIIKNLRGDVSIENLVYNNIKFNNIGLNNLLINDKIQLNSLKMNGQGGRYDMSLITSNLSSPEVSFQLNGLVSNLKIKELFYEFDNFDQNWILDRQISGQISSFFDTKLYYRSNGEFLADKFYLNSNNNFDNLQITEFSFLKELLSYFGDNILTKKIIDLEYYSKRINSVDFDSFQSNISVKNNKVVFGETNITNNLLDVSFFGTYFLSDSIDYHLNFNWRDIKKKNKRKNDFDIEDDGFGKQLFLKVYGDLEDIKYGLDKKESKKNRKQKLKEEKQVLKDIIKGKEVNEIKDSPVFEVEIDGNIDNDSIENQSKSDLKKKKPKKKKDSSRFNKFLKKMGVEDEVKKKPKFEIDQ